MESSLGEDLNSPEFRHGVDQKLWRLLDRKEDTLWVELQAADSTLYMMELGCSEYGELAISGRFVDPATRTCVTSAWPRGNDHFQQWIKFQDGNLFICWDQDRLGVSHHADPWSERKAWKTAKPNQLVAYLTFIARLLNNRSFGYEDRAAMPS